MIIAGHETFYIKSIGDHMLKQYTEVSVHKKGWSRTNYFQQRDWANRALKESSIISWFRSFIINVSPLQQNFLLTELMNTPENKMPGESEQSGTEKTIVSDHHRTTVLAFGSPASPTGPVCNHHVTNYIMKKTCSYHFMLWPDIKKVLTVNWEFISQTL